MNRSRFAVQIDRSIFLIGHTFSAQTLARNWQLSPSDPDSSFIIIRKTKRKIEKQIQIFSLLTWSIDSLLYDYYVANLYTI